MSTQAQQLATVTDHAARYPLGSRNANYYMRMQWIIAMAIIARGL